MFLLLIHGTCDCFSVPNSGGFCKFIAVSGHVTLKYLSGDTIFCVLSAYGYVYIFVFTVAELNVLQDSDGFFSRI